jgi:hypothetical protein
MKHNTNLIISFASTAVLFLAGAVTNADVIPPGGLLPGDQYQLIFITAGTRNATSADIADYNAFVTNEAAHSSGLPAGLTWRAVASTPYTDARDNALAYDDFPIYNTLGQRIADRKSDLWDGSITNAIYDQNGLGSGDPIVWTGSEPDGTKKHIYGPLVGPLGSNSPYITFGTATFIDDGQWLDRGALHNFHETHSFYAMSEPIVYIIVPEPETLILLSMGLFIVGFCELRRR